MKRRTLIGAGGLWLAPLASHAQPARKVYRIGILTVGPTAATAGPQPQSQSTSALLRGLRELGYVYGETFVTEPRSAEGQVERFPVLVADLIRLQVVPCLPQLQRPSRHWATWSPQVRRQSAVLARARAAPDRASS